MSLDTSKIRVLVVDDHHDLNSMLREYINEIGMDSVGETNPKNVVNHLKTNKFDLILSDISMPEMSGLDLVKEIRKQFSSIDLPVIMVTSRDDDDSVIESLNLGANDFVAKPVKLPVLKSRMQTQLLLAKQARELKSAQTYKTIQSMLASYDSKIETPLDLIKRVLEKIKIESPELVKNINRLQHLIELANQDTKK